MEKFPVTAATGALGPVMDKLAALMGTEYKLRRRTWSDIKFIKSKLKSMHSLLWSICERGLLDAASKEMKMEALDLADDVDDVIDDFIVSMERSPSNKRFIQMKVKANHFKDFKRRVNDVSRRCRGMWKKKKTSQPISTPQAHPFIRKDTSELVGLVGPRDEIIQHLLGEQETTLVEPQLKMASICGMAGMGKTTLSRLVYEEIEHRFLASAFVSLTTSRSMKVGLTSILDQVAADCSVTLAGTEAATEDHLVRIISKFLEDKRYLIIIDNIWHYGDWEIISKCFPENNTGSRIVTTTRLSSIAEKWCGDYHAFLHRMDPELYYWKECWAYGIHEDVVSQMIDMKSAMVGEPFEFDHPIVDICDGMPLAVDCMLSACAKEREHQEQQGACVTTRELQDRVEEQVKRNGIQNTPGFEPLVERLQLYYDDLPHLMLKTCLLYCGVFPVDYYLEVEDMVSRWIIEGFVYERKAAKGYFEELVNLGFLQQISGSVGYCRMHPVMRNFLRCKSREDNFTTSSCEIPSTYTCRIRRLFIDDMPRGDAEEQVLFGLDWSHIRSLIVGVDDVTIVPFKKMESLRVLRIHGTSYVHNQQLKDVCGLLRLRHLFILKVKGISEIPSEIGRLQHLETLKLWGTGITELPGEIGKLQQLKTLDVEHTEITVLPGEIQNLQHLETLCVSHAKITELPGEIGKLQQLKTLDVSHTKITKLPKEIGNLQHLETLRLKGTCVMKIPREIGRLNKLENLEADFVQNVVRLPLEICQVSKWVKLPDCIHEALKKGDLVSSLAGEILSIDQDEEEGALVVGAKHMHIPQWLKEHFKDIAALEIRICKLDEEGLHILREMPNLLRLILRFEVVPREPISISREGFTRLEQLLIDSRVPRVTFQEGAMPMLETLAFEFQLYGGPPNYDPIGTYHLKSLKRVIFICSNWYRADRPCISATMEVVRKEAQEHPNRITLELIIGGNYVCFPENKSAQISEETNEASSSGTGEIQD